MYGKERNINLYNVILIQFLSQKCFLLLLIACGFDVGRFFKSVQAFLSVVHESADNGHVDYDGNFPWNILSNECYHIHCGHASFVKRRMSIFSIFI